MNASADNLRDLDLDSGFGVGNCWVEPLAGIIQCGELRLHVEPKVMDVLTCLARSGGAIVTRDALLQSVWGGVVVTDDVLTRCISELRTILGDTDRERRFIRTIPKRGYSLIAPVYTSRSKFVAAAADWPATSEPPVAPVQTIAAGGDDPHRMRRPLQIVGLMALALLALLLYRGYLSSNEAQFALVDDQPAEAAQPRSGDATAERPADATGNRPRSLAVLPFVNLSGDPRHDFFSDGLSEDIRNGMLTSTDLRVSARTSSRAFKDIAIDVREIGRQLDVDALLEGTVRINDDHLRVTTQLTDANDGYPIWAASYERDLGESISTQVEVAESIIRDLAPSVSTSQHLHVATPTNIAAYEYYLLGRHQWQLREPASLALAVTYFEDALELDPNYALAYSGLADAHLLSISYAGKPAQEMIELAQGYTARALELGPGLAETHASHGLLFETMGQFEKARDAYLRAVEIKPQYSMAQMWLGNTLLDLRDIDRAFRHLSIARELDPLHPQVQYNYANALMLQGRYDDAKTSIDNFLRFRQSELLTHQKLAVDFNTGRYDLMLKNAVGYTHAGTFTPYNSQIVIEALIYLQRFDEAERMIDDNAARMDDWTRFRLRGELAVARRDAGATREIARIMSAYEPGQAAPKKAKCVGDWAGAFAAAADFIAADYAAAVPKFEALAALGPATPCLADMPDGFSTLLAYIAVSRMRIDPDDPAAAAALAEAADEIARLRERGIDSTRIGIVDAAVRWYRGDEAGANAVLERLNARNWRVFGMMRFSPLYDELLAAPLTEGLVAARGAFEPVETACAKVGLSKLGL